MIFRSVYVGVLPSSLEVSLRDLNEHKPPKLRGTNLGMPIPMSRETAWMCWDTGWQDLTRSLAQV